MRRIFLFAGFVISIGLPGAAGMVWWGLNQYHDTGPAVEDTLVTVPSGASVNRIAAILEQERAIENENLFRLAVRISGRQGDLKAGEYLIEAGSSQKEVLDLLVAGKTFQRAITIPEGLTNHEIVKLINEKEMLGGTAINELPVEGSLLPETYSFVRKEDRSSLINRMQAAMDTAITELWNNRAENLPISEPEEAVILASIVEKETGVSEERARIAGVFINRLRKGMALQSDPTVIYALTLGKHDDKGKGPLGRRLLRKDLVVDSPYNTYRYPGLPPGPIANPGRDALAAVLNPEEHDYLYFVANGKGGHFFATTLAEHNRNVSRWRKIRRGLDID